jgi:hypothetical protein
VRLATHPAAVTCAVVLAVMLTACGAAQPPADGDQSDGARQVVFSVANKDRSAPVTLMKVVVNGRTLIYGSLQLAGKGEYLYVSTRIAESKLRLRVTSETDEGPALETVKTMLVEERLWVVITRLRDMDGDPELIVEASYEKPGPWSEE